MLDIKCTELLFDLGDFWCTELLFGMGDFGCTELLFSLGDFEYTELLFGMEDFGCTELLFGLGDFGCTKHLLGMDDIGCRHKQGLLCLYGHLWGVNARSGREEGPGNVNLILGVLAHHPLVDVLLGHHLTILIYLADEAKADHLLQGETGDIIRERESLSNFF